MIMHPKIRAALDRFEVIGPGGNVPHEDLDNVQEHVAMLLATVEGISPGEASDLVRFLQWGSWAEGWESGYASGARRATPRFSLGNRS